MGSLVQTNAYLSAKTIFSFHFSHAILFEMIYKLIPNFLLNELKTIKLNLKIVYKFIIKNILAIL